MTERKQLYVITNDGREIKMEDWNWETNSPKEGSPRTSKLFDEEMMKLFQDKHN
jgi:hypothetical protein